MFFMGEEKGALQDFKYNDFLGLREDLLGARNGSGAHLFRFYSDLIAFRKNSAAVRSKSIRILHHREPERMIAFRRTAAREDLLVVRAAFQQLVSERILDLCG